MNFSNKTKLLISVSANPTNFGVTIYNYLFNKLSMNYFYLPVKITDAQNVVNSIRSLNIHGCSVSSPLKSSIYKLLDSSDRISSQLKNVNTIKNSSGKLKGYNTDYFGFNKLIQGKEYKSVLIYGYGSVVETIVLCLKQNNIKNIYITGRDQSKVEAFSRGHKLNTTTKNLEFDLLINATPSGGKYDDVFKYLDCVKNIIDLNVNNEKNDLVNKALLKNINTVTGSEMSIYQLQKQFEIYFDTSLDENLLREALMYYLN
tara:strand:+ start:8191 stop:8967 length:777 start_codon:yes stop_codon:yes gene_type:complete